ncbi:hypothetical protein [Salinisphaera hydrothermalis]|uniref:Transmembrane protein n=1 Tax=Salinisphaera hydrothermalis (strain C41B8) TaxID=1304275 RepID=A0A084IN34_SALHC|nr:hypothetical protein [Salinisphaera hydrothermalis]KEZ78118.1 hypothetical protein C41B8_06022 [Salinisphaera hydrothermalis C41B8]
MFAFIKAFVAGLIAIVVFNQGALWLIDRAGFAQVATWSTQGLMHTDVPVIAWQALWGGLWGLVIWLLIRRAEAAGYYVGAIILGAVLLTGVALAVTPWLGMGLFGVLLVGYSMNAIGVALAANAAYGLGFALLMRLFHPPR